VYFLTDHLAKLKGIKVGWFEPFETFYKAKVVWSIDVSPSYLTNDSLVVITNLVPDKIPRGMTPKSDRDAYLGYFLYDQKYKLSVQVNVCGKKTSTSFVNIQGKSADHCMLFVVVFCIILVVFVNM